MSAANIDALIVGAGPVGLTMAAACTHHGLTYRIIDKAAAASDKTKALAVWCRSLELLADLGLAETLVENGLKISGASIFADGKRVVHLDLTSDESTYGFGLMIPQYETERLLTEHLNRIGISIERQVELVDVDEHEEGVTCTLQHAAGTSEKVQVPWLLGCDGAHSAVRHALNLDFSGYAEPTTWVIADVSINGPLAADEVSAFWHDDTAIVFFPYGEGRFRMIADLSLAQTTISQADVTLEFCQDIADARGPIGLTLSDPIWLTTFKINERKVADYRHGRVMIAGDAAHIHSPAGGQGMNTGMQDAFNLAWKLALIQHGKGNPEALLDSYSEERSAVGEQVLKNASRFTTLTTLHNPVALWLRNHIVPVVGSFSAVRDKVRDSFFELSINYRHSPLNGEKWPTMTKGLSPGDRLCDVALSTGNVGSSTTLFEAIRGVEHALLLLPGSHDPVVLSQLVTIGAETTEAFPGLIVNHLVLTFDAQQADPIPAGGSTWIDVDGELYRRLGAHKPTLVLVRPDGYIGFRCQPADGEALLAHLRNYLTS